MSITSILRNFNGEPNIVTIVSTDNLATITTAGYFTTDPILSQVQLLNNGDWQWMDTDYVLISYNGGIGFFTYDDTNGTFIAAPSSPGTLSNTLANTRIFVGNASNVATGVAMSGDATIANTGALTIANNAITSAKTATNLIQYARVALSAAQFLGMYATPVQIVAAAGANTAIIVDHCILQTTYGTTQTAAGGAVVLQYGNSAHAAGSAASATIAAATLNAHVASALNLMSGANANTALSAAVNTGVFISNDTAAFTTGDSTYFVDIWYQVIATV